MRAAEPATVVRVLDSSGTEGIPGIVLLLNPGRADNSRAFVTDPDGRAFVPGLSCGLCTITAQDPRGLFLSKTTEFNAGSPSVTLKLQVRPIIDTVGYPGSMRVNVTVLNAGGEPLPEQLVALRPNVVTVETNRVNLGRTDSRGVLNVQLLPGEYTVAALLKNKPCEATFRIGRKNAQRTIRVHLHPPDENYRVP